MKSYHKNRIFYYVKYDLGPRETTYWVKRLPNKHENLILDSQPHVKAKCGMVSVTPAQGGKGSETGRSLSPSNPAE